MEQVVRHYVYETVVAGSNKPESTGFDLDRYIAWSNHLNATRTRAPGSVASVGVPKWADGRQACLQSNGEEDAGEQPNGFYTELEFSLTDDKKEELVAAAKAVCRECVLIETCLDYALETNQAGGVWGGLTEKQRKVVKRNRKNIANALEAD